ncbi:hypothetical protein [Phreatobacter stygius]|uniref:Uncharacterized protein n=1 Tax=Phreatobacter stygius TaxID=1940610 RepID=A0A4D7AUF9_9HYPH|nr:hypothetical protein [Phreatobacter stygius]QCI65294.1 hypothetical protein E8M01_14385 [Phreatobacter stygius]
MSKPVEDLAYAVEEWDEKDQIRKVLARVSLLPIGFGAYEAAVAARPTRRITLRIGLRVIRKNYQEWGPDQPDR